MNDDIDPALMAILTQLWRAHHEPSGPAWSLAKLAKQTRLPMSALRRLLTGLSDAGLVCVTLNDQGTGRVRLSDAGVTLCRQAETLAP